MSKKVAEYKSQHIIRGMLSIKEDKKKLKDIINYVAQHVREPIKVLAIQDVDDNIKYDFVLK